MKSLEYWAVSQYLAGNLCSRSLSIVLSWSMTEGDFYWTETTNWSLFSCLCDAPILKTQPSRLGGKYLFTTELSCQFRAVFILHFPQQYYGPLLQTCLHQYQRRSHHGALAQRFSSLRAPKNPPLKAQICPLRRTKITSLLHYITSNSSTTNSDLPKHKRCLHACPRTAYSAHCIQTPREFSKWIGPLFRILIWMFNSLSPSRFYVLPFPPNSCRYSAKHLQYYKIYIKLNWIK